jgi:hypothetical protein
LAQIRAGTCALDHSENTGTDFIKKPRDKWLRRVPKEATEVLPSTNGPVRPVPWCRNGNCSGGDAR